MKFDIVEVVRNAPKGSLKIFNGHNIGLDENCINEHLNNKTVVQKRIIDAISQGFYIEAISLRILILDFWLRVYIRNADQEVVVVRREFGNLLKMAKKLGLPSDIWKQVDDFNKDRVKAIHGFLLGKVSLDDLEPIAKGSSVIVTNLTVWVIENGGEVITDISGRHCNVGDMILKWQESVEQIKGQL